MTKLSSEDILKNKPGGFKSRLGLTKEKSNYFFQFQVPKSMVKNEGNSEVKLKIGENFKVSTENQINKGKTQK